MKKTTQQEKLVALKAILTELGPCAVAFSAGVDSTLLLAIAHEAMGNNVMAITADSPAHPARELEEAREFCQTRSIRHVVFDVNELEIEGFERNPIDRCYLCKNYLFTHICALARKEGFPTVLEGSNLDDMNDYRPGFKAIQELGVKSPLLEARLTKQDIRELSQQLGLPTADKQSFACLFSRFPYNTLVTTEKLEMVDAAEQLLLDAGIGTVRVRMEGGQDTGQGSTARIEIDPSDFDTLLQQRTQLVDAFNGLGFAYVALDLQGYRTGAMNESLATSTAE